MKYRARTWASFAVNRADGWRETVGMLLRKLAQRIDGRYSLAIRLQSLPPVPAQTRMDIIHKGLDRMQELLVEEAEAETIEAGMRVLHPDLYE